MSLEFTERYRYHGPSSGIYPLERVHNEEESYLKQRIRCMQSLRMLDAQGNFDAEKTHQAILSNARQLPAKEGFHYVLNIADPKKPRLEQVKTGAPLPRHYRTLEYVSAPEQENTNGKKGKRKFKHFHFGKTQGEEY